MCRILAALQSKLRPLLDSQEQTARGFAPGLTSAIPHRIHNIDKRVPLVARMVSFEAGGGAPCPHGHRTNPYTQRAPASPLFGQRLASRVDSSCLPQKATFAAKKGQFDRENRSQGGTIPPP